MKGLKYRSGSTVHVRLFDGRTVLAKVCFIENTVAGRKVTTLSGSLFNRVDAQQIVRVVKL